MDAESGVASCCGLRGLSLSVVCCRNGCVDRAVWAQLDGGARVIAYRWLDAELSPVPTGRVGRLILGRGAVRRVWSTTADGGVCTGVLGRSEGRSRSAGSTADRMGDGPARSEERRVG